MLMSTSRFQFSTGVSQRYPNCSTPALLTNKPDWTDVAVGTLGEGLHGIGVADIAFHGRRHASGRDELVA